MPDEPIEIPQSALDDLAALRAALAPIIPVEMRFGIGFKQTAGEYTNAVALIVSVPEKKPLDYLPQDEQIPAQFGGYPTDVVEDRREQIADDVTYYTALRGGIRMGPKREIIGIVAHENNGTLGAIVRLRTTGDLQLLTCGHVAKYFGENIFHPGEEVNPNYVVGQTQQSMNEGNAWPPRDWALVNVNPPRGLLFSVKEIGNIEGIAEARLNEIVRKRGQATQLTTGKIRRIWKPRPNEPVYAIDIEPVPPHQVFCWKGDSGSVVLNSRNEVVALLIQARGYPTNASGLPILQPNGLPAESEGYAIPIDTVLSGLGIDIAVTPTITEIAPNSAAAMAQVGTPAFVIKGYGFTQASTVRLGTFPLAAHFTNSRQMEAIPAIPPFLPWSAPVVVTNERGEQSAVDSASMFTY